MGANNRTDLIDCVTMLETMLETETDLLRKVILDSILELIGEAINTLELSANVFHLYGTEHSKKARKFFDEGNAAEGEASDAKASRNFAMVDMIVEKFGITIDEEFTLDTINTAKGK